MITNLVLKDVMILRSLRHHTEEEVEGYRLHSRLTIHQVNNHNPPGAAQSFFIWLTLDVQVTRSDFGAYKCVSKNSLGEFFLLVKQTFLMDYHCR